MDGIGQDAESKIEGHPEVLHLLFSVVMTVKLPPHLNSFTAPINVVPASLKMCNTPPSLLARRQWSQSENLDKEQVFRPKLSFDTASPFRIRKEHR